MIGPGAASAATDVRGYAQLYAYYNGSKRLTICDSARDGHGGPAVRLDIGSSVVQYSVGESQCGTFYFGYSLRKVRLTWASGYHTTAWMPSP